jgi:MOSC domain-containing protein YiiM
MALAVTLFVGGVRPLPGGGEPTGIYKREQPMPVWIGREGIAGDQQADRRVHGGPGKAVHLYPADHYPKLAAAFPALAGQLRPGVLGENLSVTGLTETDVRVGDVFRLGDATLQVSRARTPCWKIDRRLGAEGVTAYIAEHGLTGWYFRVLEEGQAQSGDELRLLTSALANPTLAACWQPRSHPSR